MEYSPDGTNWLLLDQQVDNCTLVGKDDGVMTFVPGYGGTSMPSDTDERKNKSGYAQFYNAEFYKFRNPVSGVSGSDAAVIMNGNDAVLNIDLKSAKIASVSGSGSVFIDGNGEKYTSENFATNFSSQEKKFGILFTS